MKKPLITYSIAALCLFSGIALAANMNFLSNQALARMTPDDATLFSAAASKALRESDDTSVAWNNPKTGASGTITPHPDPEKETNCRLLHMVSIVQSVKDDGYYRFCKQADGTWPLVMPSSL